MDDGGSARGGSTISATQIFTIQVDWDAPWHNRAIAADVTDDGVVAADDALDIINRINAKGSGPLTSNSSAGIAGLAATNGEAAPTYYDVTGDNYLAADDVIAVINYINAHPKNHMPAGEGEATSDLLLLLAADVAVQSKRRN
jgi:hypothetical protein